MSADRVVSLVRRRVEEYQARAAREAPTPPPAPAAAVVTPFEDDDDEFVFSRAQLQKRVSASAAARAGGGGTSVGDEVDLGLSKVANTCSVRLERVRGEPNSFCFSA
ncbi:unnamed protein product [Closterium sp. NIES-54]